MTQSGKREAEFDPVSRGTSIIARRFLADSLVIDLAIHSISVEIPEIDEASYDKISRLIASFAEVLSEEFSSVSTLHAHFSESAPLRMKDALSASDLEEGLSSTEDELRICDVLSQIASCLARSEKDFL